MPRSTASYKLYERGRRPGQPGQGGFEGRRTATFIHQNLRPGGRPRHPENGRKRAPTSRWDKTCWRLCGRRSGSRRISRKPRPPKSAPASPSASRWTASRAAALHGHVDSLQSGSGSRFSLLPPENAVGNYVKVVQRVPVRIVFDDPVRAAQGLGPGMSVSPSVELATRAVSDPVVAVIALVIAAVAGWLFWLFLRRQS